jgi:twitching motility protein PilT
MRIDGALTAMNYARVTPPDSQRIAYDIMTDEQIQKFETNLELDFSYSLAKIARFRVNVYHQRGSVGAAFRLIPSTIQTFQELGLPQVLEDLVRRPRGFVLVTGPTGSGKSTTLASMIEYINRHEAVHIITVEDPIEYLHHHKESVIEQREVGADTSSFATALKYVLRQDPDVILFGEMRDLETVQAALTAAETGHLVLATLHTQDAVQTIDRIIDVFPSYQQQQVRIQLASTLQGIISQQLLPIIDGRSRVVATEVLIATPAIRNMIRDAKTHQLPTAMQTGHQYGMRTMDESLADLYRSGRISLDTALSRAVDQQVLRTLLEKQQ